MLCKRGQVLEILEINNNKKNNDIELFFLYKYIYLINKKEVWFKYKEL